MRRFRTIDSACFHNPDPPQLRLVEETLSDGSKAYSVFIGTYEYLAANDKDATTVFTKLVEALLSGV